MIDDTKPYEIFDPEHIWKRKTIENFEARPILKQIFKNGECIYESKPLDEIKAFCAEQVDALWDEVKRFENPHKYYVDLSQSLWDIKNELLKKYSK